MCVCVCVWGGGRERERESVCVCVYVREREINARDEKRLSRGPRRQAKANPERRPLSIAPLPVDRQILDETHDEKRKEQLCQHVPVCKTPTQTHRDYHEQ